MPSCSWQKPLKNILWERFALEYSRHAKKERAVIAAGYNCKTSKEGSTSASVQANILLKNDAIRKRVQWLQENRARKADFTELKILRELRRIAFFDIRKIYDEGGNLKQPNMLDADTAAAISSVDIEKLFGTNEDGRRAHIGYTVKVKTADKIAALEKLMRYFCMIETPDLSQPSVINTHIENKQVNFYLPENPRHAKVVNGHTDASNAESDLEAESLPNGGADRTITLPAKRANGKH